MGRRAFVTSCFYSILNQTINNICVYGIRPTEFIVLTYSLLSNISSIGSGLQTTLLWTCYNPRMQSIMRGGAADSSVWYLDRFRYNFHMNSNNKKLRRNMQLAHLYIKLQEQATLLLLY